MTLFGHIFFIGLTAVLIAIDYDILPLVFDKFPLFLKNDVDFRRGIKCLHDTLAYTWKGLTPILIL